ncbi:hypothetical protein GQ54DRAFT_34271 [Martensiomyces pterosporus]|nr:hypothetical protein GQ54DRAFT_34271 [Martensiomyces pterosporus]
MSRPSERKPAKLVETSGVRVPRYFPGKAPEVDVDLSASEDEGEVGKQNKPEATASQPVPQRIAVGKPRMEQDAGEDEMSSGSEGESDAETRRLLQARLRARQRANDEESDSGDSSSDSDLTEAMRRAAMHRRLRTENEYTQVGSERTAAHSERSGSGSSGSGAESDSSESGSESESDSDEDDGYAPRPLLKPVFVPKSQRQAKPEIVGAAVGVEGRKDRGEDRGGGEGLEAEAEAEAQERKKEERRIESVRLAAEEAKRAMEEPEIDNKESMGVDDTDDVDPKAEFEAWKLRELLRIKRDKEERENADLEEEERERRRNMTEEEKYKQDMEKVRKQKEDRRQREHRSVPGQKFFHKGAFFQDSGEEIYQRNFTDPRPDESVQAVQELPEYLRLKALDRNAKSKWGGYKKEDTSSTSSLWSENRRMARRMAERSRGLHDDRHGSGSSRHDDKHRDQED